MMIRRNPKHEGVCFAWLPKRTPSGLVWLEWVGYKYDEHGLGGISYRRLP